MDSNSPAVSLGSVESFHFCKIISRYLLRTLSDSIRFDSNLKPKQCVWSNASDRSPVITSDACFELRWNSIRKFIGASTRKIRRLNFELQSSNFEAICFLLVTCLFDLAYFEKQFLGFFLASSVLKWFNSARVSTNFVKMNDPNETHTFQYIR